jgi:hypothetical protein
MLRYLMGLLLLAFLCAPASANVVRPMASHPGADDLMAACGGGEFSWGEGGGYTCTKRNCDGKGGHCTVSCDQEANCNGSTPSIVTHLPGLFDAATTMAPAVPFGLNHVSRGQLLSACKSVGGAFFGGDKNYYFCANPHCDPGIGPCYVDCDLSKCTAGMPKKPTGGLTIVAILQGGKGIIHGGQLDEGSTTKSAPAPEAPKPPPFIPIP